MWVDRYLRYFQILLPSFSIVRHGLRQAASCPASCSMYLYNNTVVVLGVRTPKSIIYVAVVIVGPVCTESKPPSIKRRPLE